MDIVRTDLLQDARESIVADLDVEVIIDQLYANNVVDSEEFQKYQNMKQINSQRDQARHLLDSIAGKDDKAYDEFVKSLEKHYSWLAKKLKVNDASSSVVEKEDRVFSDALTLGDLPSLPRHYVPRTAKLEELRTLLKNMKRGDYVVIHGMPGAGKSCLASSAINDKILLKESFKNRIFWIKLGDVTTETDLSMRLSQLYKKLEYIHWSKNSQQSLNITDGIDFVKDKLRQLFMEESLRQSLLVLDDVSKPEVIDAFNLNCKVLVTTRNRKVVSNASNFLQLTGGFTETESLRLFADCLGVDVSNLPVKQATEMHKLCKGGPMLIALIGMVLEQNKEDAICKIDRWNDYISRLRKKQYKFEDNTQITAIGMCVEDLNEQLREYYKYFALFVEDVNIMPEVLQTIWHLDKYTVEEIMTNLKNKSLLDSVYNRQLGSRVYGIHDLLLAYLKSKLTDEEKVALHRELISSYRAICNNKFADLPNDNYIYSYIGYHLSEAQMWSEFTNLYLDLEFIGAKLKVVGAADLLADIKRYRQHITNNHNSFLSEKLEAFEKFIAENGPELNKFPNVDVIQRALQQPKSGEVYKQALSIAKQRPKRLYFQLSFEGDGLRSKSTLELPDNVTTACFTLDTNRVLVGTNVGKITLWEQDYKRVLYTFHGHTKPVTHLIMHPFDSGFISSSTDGTVKLWSLDDIPATNYQGNTYDENGFNDKTPSPRTRQPNWSNVFENEETRDKSQETYYIKNDKITCAALSHDGKKLVTGTEEGVMVIWNLNPKKVLSQLSDVPKIPRTCCTFSLDDSCILYAYESTIAIGTSDSDHSPYHQDIPDKIKMILIIPESFTDYVVICEHAVYIVTMELGLKDFKLRGLNGGQTEEYSYTCGAVTVNGQYVVAGASNFTMRMWDIASGKLVREMLDNNGVVICLDTFLIETPDVTHLLLSAVEENTVKQWEIPSIDLGSVKKNKLKELFSAKFCSGTPHIAAIDNENNVLLYNGLLKVAETRCMKYDSIKTLDYNASEKKIAVGCSSGKVFEFHQNSQFDAVMSLDSEIGYLEYLSDGILVAADKRGILMIRQHSINHRLSPGYMGKEKNSSTHYPFIKCFLLAMSNKLIAITGDCVMKCWDLSTFDLENILVGSQNIFVTSAAINKQKNMVAFTDATDGLRIYNLVNYENDLGAELSSNTKFDSNLISCCFSPDSKIIAIGQTSGQIVLWSVECKSILTTLELHRSAVRHLSFGPPAIPLVLVSVGEQVAWWDISSILQKNEMDLQRRKWGSARFSVSRLASIQNLCLDNIPTNGNQYSDVWSEKTGIPNKPELLACIKLRGTFANHVQASADFTCFTTIDDHGLIYIMNVLKTD